MHLGVSVVGPNLEEFITFSSIGIILWDLDADDIISNGLQEEGSYHPEHVYDEIQEDGLWRGKRI